jgi:hypothetical protein
VTDSFPFLFFNHGPIEDIGSIDKCEELYVWFAREVTEKEKERIMERCPTPVAAVWCFADRFAYIGSPGDCYDGLVMEAYGGEAAAILHEAAPEDFGDIDFYSILEAAVPKFVEDFERWAREVHRIVPIVFLRGPTGASEDDPWNVWSHANASRAVAEVAAYAKVNPSLAAPRPESDEESHEDAVARYFSYIFRSVLSISGGKIDDARAIDFAYATDGIDRPITRLDSHEHQIHVNGALTVRYLEGTVAVERRRRLAALSPYAQLAYLASYAAMHEGDLGEDLASVAATLVDRLDHHRRKIATSLLEMIANNLVHVTPAWETHDKTRASLAARVMELAASRSDATEEVFLHASTFCEWAGEHDRSLAHARAGHTRFPKSVRLANNLVSAASALGDTERARDYAALAAELATSQPPDETLAMNQSYALAQAGKPEEALTLLLEYRARGGEMTGRVWGNISALHSMTGVAPSRELLEALAADMLAKLGEDFAIEENAIAGATALLNSHGFAREAVEILERAQQEFGLGADLLQNYTYSAYRSEDAVIMRRAARATEERIAEEELEHAPLHDNLASLYAAMGEIDRAIEHIVRCRALGYQSFPDLRRHADLRALWGVPAFERLFVEAT